MKLHVNRTCFHAGLKSQTGMSLFRLSCERTLTETQLKYNEEDATAVCVCVCVCVFLRVSHLLLMG